MSDAKPPRHPFARPPGEGFLREGRAPLLYALLTSAELEEKPPVLKMDESSYYRARGYELFGPTKPLSKCFAPGIEEDET